MEVKTDSLTGAYNKRYLNQRLMADIEDSVIHNKPLSIILCDIDHFKYVNDSYGHLAGDLVLKTFVEITKSCIRENHDWIARYGGDEFLIVLINDEELVTEKVAKKIKTACEQTYITHENSSINFTVSSGACTSYSKQITMEELIGLADKSLYIAKKAETVKTSVGAN